MRGPFSMPEEGLEPPTGVPAVSRFVGIVLAV
jgi:hypothetical protein